MLVANGSPRRLMEEIDATVVEITTEHVLGARAALAGVEGIESVAQLGSRLHALVESRVEDPAERLDAALRAAGIDAEVRVAAPNLEDVFVAVTRRAPEEAAA